MANQLRRSEVQGSSLLALLGQSCAATLFAVRTSHPRPMKCPFLQLRRGVEEQRRNETESVFVFTRSRHCDLSVSLADLCAMLLFFSPDIAHPTREPSHSNTPQEQKLLIQFCMSSKTDQGDATCSLSECALSVSVTLPKFLCVFLFLIRIFARNGVLPPSPCQ